MTEEMYASDSDAMLVAQRKADRQDADRVAVLRYEGRVPGRTLNDDGDRRAAHAALNRQASQWLADRLIEDAAVKFDVQRDGQDEVHRYDVVVVMPARSRVSFAQQVEGARKEGYAAGRSFAAEELRKMAAETPNPEHAFALRYAAEHLAYSHGYYGRSE